MDYKSLTNTRKSFLLIFIFLINFFGYSQTVETGIPFIQNYSPAEYNFENQNFSIVQDNRGFIYVGSLNGILEFDGHFWNQLEIKGEIRLAVSNLGKIYVGAYDNLGVLDFNDQNKLEFKSLISLLEEKDRSLGQINNVLSLNNSIIFSSDKNIYLYDGQHLNIIASTYTFFRTFKVNNKIYVYKNLDGLYTIRSNSLELVDNGDFFVDREIIDIVPLESGMLVKTNNNNAPYLYAENGIVEYQTQADDFFGINGYTKAVQLQNKTYAIGTERCGIVFLNKFGNLLGHINKTNGLLDDKVNNIFVDKAGYLWLALSNGISRVEYPSSYSIFNSSAGIRGVVNTINRQKNNIYVGTTQGLYYLNPKYDFGHSCSSANIFKPVQDIDAECRYILPVDKRLLVATSNGLYEVINNKAKLIFEGNYNFILQSDLFPNTFYLAKKTGLSAMNLIDGRWIELGDLQNLTRKIRSIYETKDGMLWLGSQHHGAFFANVSNGYDIYNHVSQYKTGKGFDKDIDWMDVFPSSRGPVFSTKNGIYNFDKESQTFIPDSILGIKYAGQDQSIIKFVEDANGNIWFSSGIHGKYQNFTGCAVFNKESNSYTIKSIDFNRLKNHKIEAIFPDINGVTWLGGYNGLVRYDENMIDNKTLNNNTYIRKIKLKKDSVLLFGVNNENGSDKSIEINYAYNSLLFEYVMPNFESNSDISYQYKLDGFEKNWSDWTPSNSKEYTNLSRGKYKFSVRSKNELGQISNEASFNFKILPSLFTSGLAYFYYLLVAASLLFMFTKWRSYRFAKERYELEQIINARTEELAYEKEKTYELFAKATSEDELSELIVEKQEESKRYKNVSILVAEISGFNQENEKKNVETSNKIFKYFDIIAERNQLQKIKINNFTYVCVAGIPKPQSTGPVNVALAALEMTKHINELNENKKSNLGHKLFIQSGIHTGTVAALVSPKKHIPYDLQGETVNIVNRITSACEIGKVSLTSNAYNLIETFFICNFAEVLPVKFVGNIDRYTIDSIKPENSVKGLGLEPNDTFKLNYNYLQFKDLKKNIVEMLNKDLPPTQSFHNAKHSINFVNQARNICNNEKISFKDTLAATTAALMYNTGYTKSYNDHIVKSVKLAKEILPNYGYSNEQIKEISNLIHAVNWPPEPKNILEKVMCDAYFDYFGSTDFIIHSRNLFKELIENKKIKDDMNIWHDEQITILEKHEFFTETSKNLRNSSKQKTLDNLKNRVVNH